MAESSGDSDAEDIDYDELQSSHLRLSALDEGAKVSLADLYRTPTSRSRFKENGRKSQARKFARRSKGYQKEIKNALIQLLDNSDTLWCVHCGISIDELTLACAFAAHGDGEKHNSRW